MTPFEVLYYSENTGPAAIQLLQEKLSNQKIQQTQATKNVQELIRRTAGNKKTNTHNVDSDDWVFDENELDEWDKELENDDNDWRAEVIPQFALKQRLLKLHHKYINSF